MHVYFPSSFFVTLTKLKGTPQNWCMLLLLLWYSTKSCWFCSMTSYLNFLLSVSLPELLECKGNQRSHWKWGMASLYALHIKVAFSPTKAVAFDIGRTTGLARTRSTKEENRYADIIKEDWPANRILKATGTWLNLWASFLNCDKRLIETRQSHLQSSYPITSYWQTTNKIALNWPIRSITRVKYHLLTRYNSLWLWRWLPYMLSKRQDYAHRDDHAPPTYEMTSGFKSFTVLSSLLSQIARVLSSRRSATQTRKILRRSLITPSISCDSETGRKAFSRLHLTKSHWATENYYSVTTKSKQQTDDLKIFSTGKMSKTFNNRT